MRRLERPRFAYGRSIRNAIDRARMRQAGRLYADRDNLTKEDLITIKADDILASSLFGDEEGESPGDDETDHPTARSPAPAVTRASPGVT